MYSFRLVSTGIFLPKRKFSSSDTAARLQFSQKKVEELAGVKERYFVTDETAAQMGAQALRNAVEFAKVNLNQIDLILSASGTQQHPIPSTSCLIQKELGLQDSGIPCFDINSTCLSFVTALDMASSLLQTGRYKTIAIVSSEIGSKALDWEEKESAALIGDGAAAVIVSSVLPGREVKIRSAKMATFSHGSHLAHIPGGGTAKVPHFDPTTAQDFKFHMDGRKLFRMISQKIQNFTRELLDEGKTRHDEIDWVLPHQASQLAMELLAKKLEFKREQILMTLAQYGNVIAASIPITLHCALTENKIRDGHKVLVLGTSAGVSIGGLVLEF